jgi:DNA primase
MAGLIPQRFIDDLLSRVDIVDVVDPRVKLRKTGKNYSGLCPFHQEKSPSFTVQPDKQFYYCFGCGAGGNAIGFVMNFENMDFPQAVELLAKDAGLEVPREEGSAQNKAASSRHEALLQLLNDVSQWYQQQLRNHPQRQAAVNYLKKRGLSGEIARDYALGYAPPGWNNVLNQFGSDDKLKRQLLDTGMLIENPDNQKNPLYDRFRDRIMYPIRDSRGRVLGFGGRVLGDEKPKYLNSPETDVFRKGEELYGLFEAKQKLRKFERFLLVEGYMDVIALAQHGVHYAVATLGTATSTTHLRTLFKLAPELVFCFDGDNAGRDAAWRALQVILPLLEDGRSARFLFLPEGEDPDTQIRRIGKEAFEASLGSSTRLADFFYNTLSARLDIGSMEGKALLGKQALPLLDKLPKGIFRQLMLDQLSQLTGVSVAALQAQQPPAATAASTNDSSGSYAPPPQPDNRPNDAPPYPGPSWQGSRRPQPRIRVELSPCMKMVNLLIRKPDILQELAVPAELASLDTPDLDLLLKVIEIARAAPGSSPPELMSRIYATDYGSHLTQLLGREQITPEAGIAHEFQEILERLLAQQRQLRERAALLAALRQRHAPGGSADEPGQPFDS